MPNVLYEGLHPGSFILSEAGGARSRDNVTMSGTTIIRPGQVLGQITATGKFVPLAPGASDGSQTAAGVSIYKNDTTGGDVIGVAITTDAEVIAPQLLWPVGITTQQQATAIAQLRAIGIRPR